MKRNNGFPNTISSDEQIRTEIDLYYGPSGAELLFGSGVDLSKGGLYLKTNFPLKTDEDLSLRFSLPSLPGQSISCKARVAWVNRENNLRKSELPPGGRVEFIEISSEDLISISRYLG